jgi:predicted dehydrogenase
VGAGQVARDYHVPCVTAAGVSPAWIVDPDPEARRRASALVPRAAAVADLADVPATVDCAIVCTPPAAHTEAVWQLVERGVHVLCEKPLACTEKEAETLVEVAHAHGVVLQVGYYRRFHPSAQRVRSWLDDGALGRPRRCTVVGGHILRPRGAGASLMDPVQSGGGVLIDIGVHMVDRVLSWFDAVTLRAYFDDCAGGMEANALVRLDGHVRGQALPITLVISRTAELGYHAAVEFDEGTVVCPLNVGHELTVISAPGGPGDDARPRRTVDTGPPRPAVGYFGDQWAEFVAQVRGGAPRVSSLRDAVRTTAIVEACYRTRQRLVLPWEADGRP